MSPRGDPKKRPGGKLPTSFHLTPEALRLLRATADQLGVSQAAIVEMGIRLVAKRERVE